MRGHSDRGGWAGPPRGADAVWACFNFSKFYCPQGDARHSFSRRFKCALLAWQLMQCIVKVLLMFMWIYNGWKRCKQEDMCCMICAMCVHDCVCVCVGECKYIIPVNSSITLVNSTAFLWQASMYCAASKIQCVFFHLKVKISVDFWIEVLLTISLATV